MKRRSHGPCARLSLSWIALLGCCTVADAAVWRVPSDVATVQGAVDLASSGDTILVAEGTWVTPVTISGKHLVLRSERGPHRTRLEVPWGVATIRVQSQASAEISGFTFAGNTAVYVVGSRVRVHGNLFVGNSQSYGFGAAITGNSIRGWIHDNEFTGAQCDSQHLSAVITLVNGSEVEIFNNLIHDNACRGINVTVPVDARPVVFNNTLVRNHTGIYVDHLVPNVSHVYRNNVIVDNEIGLDVVLGSGDFDAEWRHNLVFGNATDYAGAPDLTGIEGNVSVDPQFIDPDFNYFVPHPASPVVDAGDVDGLAIPARDLEGAARVQDGDGDGTARIDLGAFEVMSAWIFSSGFDS